MSELSAQALEFRYPGAGEGAALSGVTLTIAPGEFVGLIGPNGSGKTTLLRCLSGLLAPHGGAVLLDGRALAGWRPAELARRVGVVAQGDGAAFEFTVGQVVAMGRYPHRRRWQPETADDRQAVAAALAQTGLTSLAERPVTALSGGERQRVALARALAQEPQTLLLDEVTAHLDLGYQAEILALLRRLNADRGLTIVAVLHDLNLAARACQRLLLLSGGRILAAGSPAEVLTPANLLSAYGVRTEVAPGRDGQLLVTVAEPGTRTGVQVGAAATAGGQTVHVICGGGAGTALLGRLAGAGYRVTCGALNRGDTDWETARLYRLEVAEEAPFSALGAEAQAANQALIRAAGAVILADVPFGPGNLANLRAAREARAAGRPVLVCDFTPLAQRDFTGGEAQNEYAALLAAGAVRVGSPEELLPALAVALDAGGGPAGATCDKEDGA
jgi:iron complex transport system ATP-binding protein